MSSFFRHLVFVRPIILRITSTMPMGFTPGFLSKGINLHALYGSISSGFSSSVANFLAILAIVFEISTDCCPKCVRIRLHSFASRPDGPCDPCVLMAAFLIC